jgi:hypothetical protein
MLPLDHPPGWYPTPRVSQTPGLAPKTAKHEGSRGGPWLLGAGCLQRPHVTAAGGAVICDGDLAGDVGVGYYFGGLAGDVGVAYYFGGLVVQSPAVFRIDHWRGCDPR